MLDEGIVLLGSTLSQWLEPVSVVCYPVLVSPLLDAFGYGVGNVSVETCAIVDDVNEFLVNVGRKILVHLLAVENFLTKEFAWSLAWSGYFNRLSLGSLCNSLKS